MLPGRHALAREYGVARGTSERAITNLVADGTLFAQEGRGTFVAPTASPTASINPSPPALFKRFSVAANLGIIAALPVTNQVVVADRFTGSVSEAGVSPFWAPAGIDGQEWRRRWQQ